MNDTTSTPRSSPSVAIIGSGPSGSYLAQFLRKRWADAEIVVFDKLPVPYGLVRFGVAPDHLGTKAVTRQFDRVYAPGGVNFVGGVEVGADISLEAVQDAFDIVVLATGLSQDRQLGIPGEQLRGIYGSGQITRLINSHPHEVIDDVTFGERVVIVGNGNVSIDLVRLLLTDSAELLSLGVAPDVVQAMSGGPVRRIDIVGRSFAAAAKFDTAMVRELAKLPNTSFSTDHARGDEGLGVELPPDTRTKIEAIEALAASSPASAQAREVHFHFGWTPELVTGDESITEVAFRSSVDDEMTLVLEADSLVTAIGFVEPTSSALPRHTFETASSRLDLGQLGPALFCVGWLRRGPQGTIPANRADAKMVAETIISATESAGFPTGKPGLAVLAPLLPNRTAALLEELA